MPINEGIPQHDQVDRLFVHGFSPRQKIDHGLYRTLQSGSFNGTILTQFESQSDKVNPPHRFGIMVENPNYPVSHFFGSYQDVEQLTQDLKRNPDAVLASLRPQAPSSEGMFYINEPAPSSSLVNENYVPPKTELVFDHPTSSSDTLMTQVEHEAYAADLHNPRAVVDTTKESATIIGGETGIAR